MFLPPLTLLECLQTDRLPVLYQCVVNTSKPSSKKQGRKLPRSASSDLISMRILSILNILSLFYKTEQSVHCPQRLGCFVLCTHPTYTKHINLSVCVPDQCVSYDTFYCDASQVEQFYYIYFINIFHKRRLFIALQLIQKVFSYLGSSSS